MADFFISSAATNGYVVGNDGNDGLSKSTPFLTTDALNGKTGTATINGTVDGPGASVVVFPGNMEVIPEVAEVSKLTFGAKTRAFGETGGALMTIGALVIDSTNVTSELFFAGNTTGGKIVVNGATYTGVIPANGVAHGLADAQIEANNIKTTELSFLGGNDRLMFINSGGASGAMRIDGADLSGLSAAFNNVNVFQAVGLSTSGTATAKNITGTFTTTSAAGTTRIVRFDTCLDAEIGPCAAIIDAQSGCIPVPWHIQLASVGGRIHDITGGIIGDKGINALIGQDPSGVGDGSDKGVIEDVDVINVTTVATTTIHGAMMGRIDGGRISRIKVNGCQHGGIIKNCTNTIGDTLQAENVNPAGNAVRHKGVTNCTWQNYLHVVNSGAEAATERCDNDTILTTGAKFINGDTIIKSGASYIGKVITQLLDAAVCTWQNCNYFDENGAVGDFFDDGSGAESFSLWQAETFVTNATELDQLFFDAENDDYRLGSNSPLRGAGLLGSAIGLTGLDGVTYSDPPNIGPDAGAVFKPVLTAQYAALASSLGDAVSIPSKFVDATEYDAIDLPEGCAINKVTGEITGTVGSPLASTPLVVAINKFTPGVTAAIPWRVFAPPISRVRASGGLITLDGSTFTAGSNVYVSPFGLLTGAGNNGPLGKLSASGSDLIVNGITLTSPAALYISPDGKLTDVPNGAPVANFLAN